MRSSVIAVAATGLLSLAMANPAKEPFRGADRSEWVSVEFQGHTIQYDPKALVHHKPSTKRDTPTSDNNCGDSTFNSGVAPYPVTTDCQALQNWAYSLNAYFSIWTNTPDYHGVAGAGSCEFGAGTRDIYDTYIGSQDMGDLISDSIKRFQVRYSSATEGEV
jgi:hypothetical protein